MTGYRSVSTLKFGKDENRLVAKIDLLTMVNVQDNYNRIDAIEFIINTSEDGKSFCIKRDLLERFLYGIELLSSGMFAVSSDYVVKGSFNDTTWQDGELFMALGIGKANEGQVPPPVIDIFGQAIKTDEKKNITVGSKIPVAHIPISVITSVIKPILGPITADKLTF